MEPQGLQNQLADIACLGDGMRRAVYLWVESKKEPVTRKQVAAGLAIPSELARFHLQRLEDGGLLRSRNLRLGSRPGRGGGRPSKLYCLARPISVSVPPRRFELLSRILVRALRSPGGVDVRVAAGASARRLGEEMATDFRTHHANGAIIASQNSVPGALEEILTSLGFEPTAEEAECVKLSNCPFHEVVEDDPAAVCHLNLRFAEGILSGLGDTWHRARLDPDSAGCCVVFARD